MFILSPGALGVGKEFIHREVHSAENVAGIRGAYCRNAVLVGQAEEGGGDNYLHGTFHADNGKDANGNEKLVSALAVDKGAVEACLYAFGKAVDAATTVAKALTAFNKLNVKADWGGNLYHNRGQSGVGFAFKVLRQPAKAVVLGVGGENAYVLFTAVKYYFFVVNGKAFYLVGFTAYAYLGGNANKIAYKHLIKALVKGHGVYGNVSGDNLCALATNRCSVVYNLLRALAKKNAYILQTVLVSGRVKDLVGGDTAKGLLFAAAEGLKSSSFTHCGFLLLIVKRGVCAPSFYNILCRRGLYSSWIDKIRFLWHNRYTG